MGIEPNHGTNSTFRNFATNYPKNGESRDCVLFGFNQIVISGWFEKPCNQSATCYFCSKPSTSKGCELIYDGSCYRSAVVIDGITWSDAQSSCENWGGDLTSISSERENNLLFTMNTDAVSDTWLGLYDVDRNGSYQWIDGTLYDYTHWSTGNPSNNLNEDCIWMYPDSTWDDFPCYVSRRRYICKRNTSDIAIAGNNYIYTLGIDRENATLVCDPMDGSLFLSNLTWHLMNGYSFSNPLNLTAMRDSLPTQLTEMECRNTSGTSILKSYIQVQGPPVITLTDPLTVEYSVIPPNMNTAQVIDSTSNVVLQTDLSGRWLMPDQSYTLTNSITFPTFNQSNEGVYKFYITDWDGNENLVIQINIMSLDSEVITLNNETNCSDTRMIPASQTQSCEALMNLSTDLTDEFNNSQIEAALQASLLFFNLLPGIPLTIIPFTGAFLVVILVDTTRELQIPILYNGIRAEPQAFPANTILAVLNIDRDLIDDNLGNINSTGKSIISDVIILVSSMNLTGILSITFTLSEDKMDLSNVMCYFLDRKTELWSHEGIVTVVLDDDRVECQTDHLTTFAVLFSSSSREKSLVEKTLLNIVSYSLLSTSLLFLSASMVIFILSWKIFFKNDISILHFNHTLALFLALACFMLGIDSVTSVPVLCTGVAFILHFLWTNVFMASLCVAVVVFYNAWLVGLHARKNMSPYLVPISWAISFIWALIWFIYAIATGVEYTPEYTDSENGTKLINFERSCFLSFTNEIIWIFFAPVLFLISVNMVILLLTMIRLRRVAKVPGNNGEELQKLRQAVCGGLLLVPVLSLPFIVSLPLVFSRFYEANRLDLLIQIFEWVFIIVNCPVGVYHFLTITMQRKEVVRYAVNIIKCRKRASSFSDYSSSTTTTTKTTPQLKLNINRNRMDNNENILETSCTMYMNNNSITPHSSEYETRV